MTAKEKREALKSILIEAIKKLETDSCNIDLCDISIACNVFSRFSEQSGMMISEPQKRTSTYSFVISEE